MSNELIKKIEIFDSTLRDGAQAEGISYSVEDKLEILKTLDAFGVDYIEGGNPVSNPKDFEFFERAAKVELKNSQLVAFGSTRRKDMTVESDPNLQALLLTKTKTVSLFGKCSLLHVTEILNTDEKTNIKMIGESVAFLKSWGKNVFFDAEHFFDGFKENQKYALLCIEAARHAGADRIILCDTNGGALPWEVEKAVQTVISAFGGKAKIGVHMHNDKGFAAANTAVSVRQGAAHIQGTFLGVGERCGNANLSTLIPTLQLTMGYSCVSNEAVESITHTARKIAEISNTSIKRNEPYIGSSAFSHKAGMHADAVIKLPHSFEHINPESVGNRRKVLISELSGSNALLLKLQNSYPNLQKSGEELKQIKERLKQLESVGYQFEGADASLELLVEKTLGSFTPFFELLKYEISSRKECETAPCARATVVILVNGKKQITTAEGTGPVNALDKALRSALEVFYPELSDMHLVDYKVRVIDGKSATAARVRTLVTSTDKDTVWSTVGASSDVVEASKIALIDSIEYKLRNNKKNN